MANKVRLIDANALMEQIAEGYNEFFNTGVNSFGFRMVESVVAKAPTVDSVEIPDCKMCEFNYTLNWHQCEGCFGNARNNFTPKMDGGNEDG